MHVFLSYQLQYSITSTVWAPVLIPVRFSNKYIVLLVPYLLYSSTSTLYTSTEYCTSTLRVPYCTGTPKVDYLYGKGVL